MAYPTVAFLTLAVIYFVQKPAMCLAGGFLLGFFAAGGVLQLVTAVLQVLSLLGLIVDPTTAGVADSQRALGYEEPYQQEKVKPPEDKMNEVE